MLTRDTSINVVSNISTKVSNYNTF